MQRIIFREYDTKEIVGILDMYHDMPWGLVGAIANIINQTLKIGIIIDFATDEITPEVQGAQITWATVSVITVCGSFALLLVILFELWRALRSRTTRGR